MCTRAQLLAFAFRPPAFPISTAFAPQRPLTPGWHQGLEQRCLRKLPPQARRISSLQTTKPNCGGIERRESRKRKAHVHRIERTLDSFKLSQYSHRQPISNTCRIVSQQATCDNWCIDHKRLSHSYSTLSRASLLRPREGIVEKQAFGQHISVLTMAKESRQATLGKFFGKIGGPDPVPQKPKSRQQSTLAFSSKNNTKNAEKQETPASENEDSKDVDKNDDPDTKVPEQKEEPGSTVESVHSDSDTGSKSRTLKREKSVETDESEDEPVSKRRRRSTAKANKVTSAKPASAAKNKKASAKVKDESEEEVVQNPPKKASNGMKSVASEISSGSDQDQESEAEQSAIEQDEEEEKKPELKKKKLEKAQAILKGSGNDPYPDWKAGDPVPYAALCTTFSLVEMTTKRLVIMSHCARFLRQVLRLTPGDLLSTVQLMINKLAADYAGIELGIGESLIMKAIGESTGRILSVIKTDQNEIGDLGLVAAKSRSNQPTMFKPKALTIKGVHDGLLNIAKVQGHGSQDKKIGGIKKLLSAADAATAGKGGKGVDITENKGGPSEAKFIVRFLEGKLRLGLAEKTVLVSLAQAMVAHETELKSNKVPSTEQLAKGESILKTVFSELPSYEVIIPSMLENGIFNLQDNCRLQPGVPLKPMLAKPTRSITEVLDRFEGKDFTCEYKYDGERAQIHYIAPGSSTTPTSNPDSKGLCAIFSRNSEDLSKKYPDVLAKLGHWIKDDTKSFVMDCETVAWDLVNKKVLPFQQLMTRKRKDVKTEDIKVQVCVFAFDLLYLNGKSTVKMSLRERRALLNKSFKPTEGEFAFAECSNTNDLEEIQTLLDQSVKASCEGLMVKMLDTEESGYEPSKRSRNWLKVKKDYLAGIGDSLDLVLLGAYYGRGKRTSVYGAFLLAAYNPTSQQYETICNIGTGFTEAVLEELHAKLSPLVIDKPKPFYSHSSVPKDQPDVWFEPRFVWEVKCADLTLSPRYKAAADEIAGTSHGDGNKGISLRFPRYIKGRDDKKPEEASSTRAVADMYRRQESVTKDSSKGGVDDDFEY